jgi:hypothetical protein
MDSQPLLAIAVAVGLAAAMFLVARAGRIVPERLGATWSEASGSDAGADSTVNRSVDDDREQASRRGEVGETVRPAREGRSAGADPSPKAPSAVRDGPGGASPTFVTESDRERMRRHLEKRRSLRRPDDLLPDAEDSDSEGS